MNFKTGDKVVVISGKDRGKEGRITKILRDENRVVVENINMIKRHQKGDGQNPGSIVEHESPIHASNVMILDSKTKIRTRIGHTTDKNNKKIRVSKKSNESLD
ncbi:MAG: 50S ribosomal protein L24 [Bacilli bacterium]|nr:50S ribosomal protein L24 [Bacilli bacterium]